MRLAGQRMVASAVDGANGVTAQLRRGTGARSVLTRQATGAFGVKLLAMGLTLGSQVLLARLLGTDGYGLYLYALTCVNFLVLPGKLGLDVATLRFLPAYRSRNESEALLRGFVRRSSRLGLVASLVVGAFLAAAVLVVHDLLRPGLGAVLLVAAAVVPASVLLQIYGARLQALKRVMLAGTIEEVVRRALFVVGLVVIGAQIDATAPLAMVVNLASTLGALAVAWIMLRGTLAAGRHGAAEYRTGEWLRAGFALFTVAGFHLVLNQADILLIGALLGTTAAGIYGVASRIAAILVFGLAAVNAIAAPLISELWTQGKRRELQAMVTWAARGVTLLCLPLGAVIVVWRRELLGLFGAGFEAGHMALAVLVIGQVVNALAGSVGNLLAMTGHQTVVVRVMATSAVLNVLMNLLLIPAWGIEGAAVATAVTTVLWNVALSYFVWIRLGIRATAL